jgi:hypothetical protein
VTETSTPPPIPENDNMTPAPSSPWVMLISMLLLISGLILSSAMLVHYAMDGKEGAAWDSFFDLAKQFAMEEGEEFSARTQAKQSGSENESSASTGSNPSDLSFKKFFSGGGGGDGTVRWPKLKVTGFGTSADAEGGFAIINGKHVLVNTFIGEVKLVEIRTHGAVVEYKGEQKILPVESVR